MLRNTLWNEHLGISNISNIKQSSQGWLKLWQKTAHNNIISLNKNEPYLNGQILPYTPEKSIENQIKDLKIKNSIDLIS